VIGSSLFIAGGLDVNGLGLTTIEEFIESSQEWNITSAHIKQGRQGHTSALVRSFWCPHLPRENYKPKAKSSPSPATQRSAVVFSNTLLRKSYIRK